MKFWKNLNWKTTYGHIRLNIIGQLVTKIKCGEKEKLVPLVVTDVEVGNNLFEADLFFKNLILQLFKSQT